MKKQHKIIQREHRLKDREEENEQKEPSMFELRQGEEFKGVHNLQRKVNKYVEEFKLRPNFKDNFIF